MARYTPINAAFSPFSPAPRHPTIPGPPGVPVLGAIPSLLHRGRFEFIIDAWRRYGEIFSLPLIELPIIDRHRGLARLCGRERAVRQLIVVSHPEAAEHVLRTRSDNYTKGPAYDVVRELLGDGLVTAVGARWRRKRRTIQPAFRRSALGDFLPVMGRCVGDLVSAWEREHAAGEPFDVYPEMMDLGRRIIGLTMFGVDLGPGSSESAEAIGASLESMGQRLDGNLALPLSLPTPNNRRFRQAVAVLDRIVYGIIDRVRRGEVDSSEPSVLQAMIAARDPETGEAMSERQLRDEVITLYIAGHETSALTLTWLFYYLARAPEVRARVEAEIDGLADPDAPSLEALDGLTYTRQVIDEVLRLRPPAWTVVRNPQEEDTILGHRIPTDASVMVCVYTTHRHRGSWGDDPESFDPDRFAPEAVAGRHRFAHIPFIGGPRVCIGKIFSFYEVLVTLAQLLRRYRLDLVSPAPMPLTVATTMRPAAPVTVRLRRRG